MPHEHVLPWLAMTVACHLALSSTREMAEMTWLTRGIAATQRCVVSHTRSRWEFVHALIRLNSCLKRCHPRVFVWDLWSCLGQQSEYKNYSHPVTTKTDGSASSPSSVSAARTPGLASRMAVKHPFSLSLHPAESQE